MGPSRSWDSPAALLDLETAPLRLGPAQRSAYTSASQPICFLPSPAPNTLLQTPSGRGRWRCMSCPLTMTWTATWRLPSRPWVSLLVVFGGGASGENGPGGWKG